MAHKGRMSSLKLPPNRILEAEIELGRKWFSCPAEVFEISFFPLCLRMNPRPTKDERGRKITKPRSVKTRETETQGERVSSQHPVRQGASLAQEEVGSCSDPSLGPEPPPG